jgi:hypothetical protein
MAMLKDPNTWDEEYLRSLPPGEYSWLEVKSRRAIDFTAGADPQRARNSLSKHVSAFANSGGGQIVLGMTDPRHAPMQVDDGGVSLEIKRPGTKEWLENVIPTLVDPPLTKFNVYIARAADESSQIAPGRGVFIIDIGDSLQAPHQATDHIYYIRSGAKSEPAGNRLVQDIAGRRRDPDVGLEFSIYSEVFRDQDEATYFPSMPSIYSPASTSRDRTAKEPQKEHIKHVLIVTARNVGRVYAMYVNCYLWLPTAILPEEKYRLRNATYRVIEGVEYQIDSEANTVRDIVGWRGPLNMTPQYGPSRYDPILPRLGHSWRFELAVDLDLQSVANMVIRWEVYADNAEPRRGTVSVGEIERTDEEDAISKEDDD